MKKIIAISFLATAFSAVIAVAATNIDATDHWAWNDAVGWIDLYSSGNVTVTSSKIQGYAMSSIGAIAFDCATAPVPDCSSPYGITHNGDGVLHGWAWNDAVGWISFNCADAGACGVSGYKTKTAANAAPLTGTLDSATYDTGGEAAFYTILYQGAKPAGTTVKFQFASSNNAAGPWNFIGPDGQGTSYYVPTGPGVPASLVTSHHNNQRYFRYRVILESDVWHALTPRVDDVIVGWSL